MSTVSPHPTSPSSPPPARLLTISEILHLAESSSSTLPSSTPHSTLLSYLHSPNSIIPTTKYITSLLTLISQTPPSPSLSSLLSSLVLSFISLFRSHQIPRENNTSDTAIHHVFHLFSLRLHILSEEELGSVIEVIVSCLSDASDSDDALPLDLLPRCLDLFGESVGSIVDGLLSADWSKAAMVKMVSLLWEFPVGARDRVQEFLQKVFSGMSAVDVQDLPSLVYQLLLLASKVFCRRPVMEGILRFFGGGLVKGTPSIVRQVEETVLMHVNFAVKQDPSLVSVVIAILKSEGRTLNYFAILVVLSIAKVRRFNETALDLLRDVVVTSYSNYKVARDCKWLIDSLKEECLKNAKHVERMLLKVVNESGHGREHIVPCIIQLGFILLEIINGDKHGTFDASEELMGIEELSIQMLRTLFEVHDMARNEIIEQCKFRILSLRPWQSLAVIKLLGFLVKHYPYPMLEHSTHLKELLDYFSFLDGKAALAVITGMLPLTKFSSDLQDYIILALRKALFRKEDTIRLAAANAIVDLILEETKLRKADANSLQESSSQASCSQQASLSYRNEYGLFSELTGLLRRCLSQEVRIREMIYNGLLKLVLLDPSVAGDVLYLLRPHFLKFYTEELDFPIVIDSCIKLVNDRVCLEEPLDCLLSCISWILLLQLHGKADIPSEFSWAYLRFSLSQDNEATKFSCAEVFSNALLRIRKALSTGKVEDMLGQCPDSSSNSLNDEKISYCMWILSRVLEVFINIATVELEKAAETGKEELETEILELVSLHESLEKGKCANNQQRYAIKGSSKSQEKKVKKNNCHFSLSKISHERRPFLASSSINSLLKTAFKLYIANSPFANGTSQNENKSLLSKTLDSCLKLISFALKACHNQIKYFSLMGSDDPLHHLINGDIKLIGRPLLQLIWLLKSWLKFERDQNIKQSKGKKDSGTKRIQLSLSLSCLNELFTVCSSSSYFAELIENLVYLSSSELNFEGKTFDDMNDEQGLEAIMQEEMVNNFLEKRVKPLYIELLELSLFQECEKELLCRRKRLKADEKYIVPELHEDCGLQKILSEMVLTTTNKLTDSHKDSHGIWAEYICKSIKVENSKTAMKVAGLAILLRSPPNDLTVAHTMAMELSKVIFSDSKLQDVVSEDDAPLKESLAYPIINHLTATGIASELLQLTESVILELNLVLSKMKMFSLGNHEINGSEKLYQFWDSSSGMLFHDALCTRSESLVSLLSCFAEMDLKDSQAEQFLKLNTKLYKILAQMVKLWIAARGYRQPVPGENFQKLVERTCKHLTVPIYTFVALVQEKQQIIAQGTGTVHSIRRESRCIPDLIFQIEDYEKYLIFLSKQCKINLLRHAKRSTARDFKIKGLKKNIANGDREEEESGDKENITVLEEKHEIPSRGGSSSFRQASDEEVVDQQKNSCSEKEVLECSNRGAPAVEISESENEDHNVYFRTKRARMGNLVQDSDEDG